MEKIITRKNLFTVAIAGLLFMLAAFSTGLATTTAFAAAPDTSRGVTIDEIRNVAYFGSGARVIVLDVSNPTNPELLSDIIRAEDIVQDLKYDPSTERLYIAAKYGGLEIWDVENPSAPQKLSTFPVMYIGVAAPVLGIDVSGDFAYVATSFGYVHWIDVSNPTQPVDKGFNGAGGPSKDVYISDGYVFVAGDKLARFKILSDGSLNAAGIPYNTIFYSGAYASGDYAYMISKGSLLIHDLNGLSFPLVAEYDSGNIRDVSVSGDYAYIADSRDGLRVLNVVDPANPVEVGFNDSLRPLDIYVSRNYAYLPNGNSLTLIDISSPQNPTVRSTYAVGSAPEEPPVVNQAPVADAGANQTVKRYSTVALDGSNSFDPDGSIASYSWEKISGKKITLINADSAISEFIAPRVRRSTTLVFELTVTDNNGATSVDQVTITVIRREPPVVNQAPVADAGANQTVKRYSTVALDGSNSFDPDGSIASYSWEKISGKKITLINADSAISEFIAPRVRRSTTLVFELTVTDNNGATSVDQVTITVIRR